jgi:D-alanine transaminase
MCLTSSKRQTVSCRRVARRRFRDFCKAWRSRGDDPNFPKYESEVPNLFLRYPDTMSTVYLNGEYIPKDRATISVDDRGFLLSDGIYEVTPAYRGRLFRMERHMRRLQHGLDALRIEYDPAGLPDMHARLITENSLASEDVAIIYMQITRGVAPRIHHFPPDGTAPTVYAFAQVFHRPESARWKRGYEAITVPDRRWDRVDIKSIGLLPNVLAQQAAVDAGVEDALFVNDGVALEGSHNNVFAVLDGVVTTHPTTHQILHGVAREYVIELAQAGGIPVEERPVLLEEMRGADEIFFTGTTTEVRPTVRLDGKPVGNGKVGPVAKALYEAFITGTQVEASAA